MSIRRCSASRSTATPRADQVARFLLVHGSCHGAWCWDGVIARLHAAGHQATAIDLPAHGADPTPPSEATLDGYARAIIDAITEPVTLVGHSAGGYPVTLAARLAPQKVARLIYLCAYVPRPGASIADLRRAAPEQPLAGAIRVDANRIAFTIDPARARTAFYHDCPEAAARDAVSRLCPEPITPQETPFPAVDNGPVTDRHYILCSDDRTIPPAWQAAMTAGWPRDRVHPMAAGHSPFVVAPDALADLLIDLAAD